ncbi:MAG: hypothetical protein M0C28_47250 [Candidatus Moduliflexus flocculans]|nr:hypothetical protein [Candidatus Moduliflexus flocculans]
MVRWPADASCRGAGRGVAGDSLAAPRRRHRQQGAAHLRVGLGAAVAPGAERRGVRLGTLAGGAAPPRPPQGAGLLHRLRPTRRGDAGAPGQGRRAALGH